MDITEHCDAREVVIQRLSLADVDAHPETFNVNNLGERPNDYAEVIARGNTGNWIDSFHGPGGYGRIDIDDEELPWLRKAAEIGVLTGRASRLFDEELDALCKCHEQRFLECLSKIGAEHGGAFIRTETVSLKYCQDGVGPYWSFRKVLENLVSSTIPGHCCIPREGSGTPLRIYILPWLTDLDQDGELRVFVNNNRVTAVSQQHWSCLNERLGSMSNAELELQLVRPLLSFFSSHVREKLACVNGSCVMDIAWLKDKSFYFIEPNSFGGGYASGSALFHWTTDYRALTMTDAVHLRLVDRP